MIHKLVLKNFKKVKDETFFFNRFDIIVGANNSGKSTALQAMAIWQYCVDQFRLVHKGGSQGIQIVLNNLSALPLPEFNLLWTNKVVRRNTKNKNTSKIEQLYTYIEIDLYWKNNEGEEKNFCVSLRYQSPQSIYAKPVGDWNNFKDLSQQEDFPMIVYVPPFSGIEPTEQWMDDGNVKQHIGKSQPGSVLRNLLFRVVDTETIPKQNTAWLEIHSVIKEWFGVDLQVPHYIKGVSTEIKVEYKSGDKSLDIISGGSGFHQILTLMAFLYGYPKVSTILLDEPDAHLHNNLQRKVIDYFIARKQKQFLIATHSEEFVRGVDIQSILSVMSGRPMRIDSTEKIIKALSVVDNLDVLRTQDFSRVLYVEGEDDDRILSAWAGVLDVSKEYQQFYPYILGGGDKKVMEKRAEEHYNALKQINSALQRIILFDYDDERAHHPDTSNPCLKEWKRKNIDNYLLIPEAWKRAVNIAIGEKENSLFLQPYYEIIDKFFASENLTLPPDSTWKNVKANIFVAVDGKKILFENSDSLYHKIRQYDDANLNIDRRLVASSMTADEMHQDIDDFFEAIKVLTNSSNSQE